MNPWAILAGLIAWAASCLGAAWLGWDYRDGKVAQEVSAAQKQTIEEASDNAVIDMEAAAERARADALAEAAARQAKEKGVTDATLKADPHCVRDTGSLSLLNAAIRAANGPPGNGGSLPEGLSGTDSPQ